MTYGMPIADEEKTGIRGFYTNVGLEKIDAHFQGKYVVLYQLKQQRIPLSLLINGSMIQPPSDLGSQIVDRVASAFDRLVSTLIPDEDNGKVESSRNPLLRQS